MTQFFNNPAIGQGFANLAAGLAPPSGADAAGYAAAQAKREEAARFAELYSTAKDPNADWSQLDRLGFGINGDARMTFESGDRDRATEIQKQNSVNQTDITKTMLAPVAEGATRFVPPSIAGMYGTPQTQTGVVSLGQGESAFLPDGRSMQGQAKPLDKGQLEAQIIAGMQPELQQAWAYGSTPIEEILGANGPEFTTRPNAIGQEPYKAPGDVKNYRTPDGKVGQYMQEPDGVPVDVITGAPLPQGSVTFSAQAQGTPDDLGVSPTKTNQTQATARAAEVTRTLGTLDMYEALIDRNPAVLGLVGLIRGTSQNAIASAQDLASTFGKDAPQINEAAAEIRNGLQSVAPEIFDPAIPEAEFLQGTLAYALARTENPSGEVSRQAFDRAYQRIQGGGMLANSQSAKAQVGAMRRVLQQELDAIGVLSGQQAPRTDIQQGAPAAGGDLPVVASPEDAMKLPPGTRFRTPDGREKVRP